MYRVPVSSVDGKTIYKISAVGLPCINDDISEVNVATLARQVRLNPREIRRGSGSKDLLIGIDHTKTHSGDSFHETDPELSDTDSDISVQPDKKKKLKSGAAWYNFKFSADRTKKVGSFIVNRDNINSFWCTLCNRTLSCGHMGLGDVQRHVKLDMHTRSVAAMRGQPTLLQLRRADPLTEKVCYC